MKAGVYSPISHSSTRGKVIYIHVNMTLTQAETPVVSLETGPQNTDTSGFHSSEESSVVRLICMDCIGDGQL